MKGPPISQLIKHLLYIEVDDLGLASTGAPRAFGLPRLALPAAALPFEFGINCAAAKMRVREVK